MVAILERAGARVVERDGDVMIFEVDLDVEPSASERLAELLRGAASSMAVFVRRMMPEASDAAAPAADRGDAEPDEGEQRE
jgi:hypothetical protein